MRGDVLAEEKGCTQFGSSIRRQFAMSGDILLN
jgi:hypothetical protein